MDKLKGFEVVELKNNDKKEDKPKFSFKENKFIFYSSLFYSFGLFIGAYFYKLVQNDKLNNLVAIHDDEFISLLLSNFCLYFSVFLITAFLGFCMIGKPIEYIVPIIIGIGVGCRISYYFVNFNSKGVGYCLIMILPYIALFMTVISYTINTSSRLSTQLFLLTKGEGNNDFELFPYIKKYLIYFALIIAVTALDSILTKLLFSVVTI